MTHSEPGLMRRGWILVLAMAAIHAAAMAQNPDANPLFSEKKVKNYLPQMTWVEVEQALTHTDAVIIPLGSIEQHGRPLPLGRWLS